MACVYFVRHGQTVWNVENKICGSTDIALTEQGHAQAIETGKKTYILVAYNGIARVVESYFRDMTNEEYAAFGIRNCEVKRYEFGKEKTL